MNSIKQATTLFLLCPRDEVLPGNHKRKMNPVSMIETEVGQTSTAQRLCKNLQNAAKESNCVSLGNVGF